MITPCLNCEKRHPACWSTCEDYAAWKAEQDALKKAKAAARARENDLNAVKAVGMKRVNKKPYER